MERPRLWERVLELGLARTPREAQGLILAGRILVNDRVHSAVNARLKPDVQIRLKGEPQRYASRGGLKLEAALAGFDVEIEGRIVLDAGASTGGFTDCLVQHGAARVYAVDAGHGQLRARLAQDARVVNLERVNVGDVAERVFAPPFTLAVADLSYLSLTKAIPQLLPAFVGPPELIVLLKPLFEGVDQSRYADPTGALEALERLQASLSQLWVKDALRSPIHGSGGSIELLVHLVSQPHSFDDAELRRALGI